MPNYFKMKKRNLIIFRMVSILLLCPFLSGCVETGSSDYIVEITEIDSTNDIRDGEMPSDVEEDKTMEVDKSEEIIDIRTVVEENTGYQRIESQTYNRSFLDGEEKAYVKTSNIDAEGFLFVYENDFDTDGENEILFGTLDTDGICQYITLRMLEPGKNGWIESAYYPLATKKEETDLYGMDYVRHYMDLSSMTVNGYDYCFVFHKKILVEHMANDTLFADGVDWWIRSILYDGNQFRDVLSESSDELGIGVSGSDGIDAFLSLDVGIAEDDSDLYDMDSVRNFVDLFNQTGLSAPSRLGTVPLAEWNGETDRLCSFVFDISFPISKGLEWVDNGMIGKLEGEITEFNDYTD